MIFLDKIKSTRNIWKKIILLVILILLIIFILSLITKPIRKKWSNNYIKTGDAFIIQKKYLHAELEYKKSLTLYWGNKTARERFSLVKKIEDDFLTIKEFYNQTNNSLLLNDLSATLKLPATSVDELKLTRQLIERGEYQLAVETAKNATEMDKNYRDTWLYLGIASQYTAENTELPKETKRNYLLVSKEALEKAKKLDSTFTDTDKYLQITNDLLEK